MQLECCSASGGIGTWNSSKDETSGDECRETLISLNHFELGWCPSGRNANMCMKDTHEEGLYYEKEEVHHQTQDLSLH